MRPGEHALSRVDVHRLAFHKHLEHRAAEGLGESSDVVERQMDERPIGTKTAIGYEENAAGLILLYYLAYHLAPVSPAPC